MGLIPVTLTDRNGQLIYSVGNRLDVALTPIAFSWREPPRAYPPQNSSSVSARIEQPQLERVDQREPSRMP